MTHPLPKLLAALALLLWTSFAGFAVAPARGADAPAPNPSAPPPPVAQAPAPGLGLAFSDFLTEDEMDMLFDYLRDAFIATMRGGEEASMPPELAFKLAILRQRLLREGDAAARQLMQALQQELDRALREYNAPPPAPPSQPPQGDPNRT